MKEVLPTLSWVEALRGIDTPTISNAIELLKLRPKEEGFAPLEIRCLYPELGRMCGYAVTAQVETVSQTGRKEEETFIELFEAVFRSPKPAVIVLQEIGERSNFAAHSGEVMATIFRQLGGIGLVSDSGVRDLAEVKALGFHYFARGAVASHANYRIVRVGIPVQILGFPVQPGDLLHGDENGLLQIPRAAFDGLLEAVASVRSRERALMDFARTPGFEPSHLRGRFLH
jgi:4-hydroxy-4-methyl-2-oxoglutarate aldolase